MIENFEPISQSEFETLKKAISWITILIAGADNIIKKEEKEWATKLTKIRSYSNNQILNDFYQEVGKDFAEQLDDLIGQMPYDVNARTAILSDKLSMLNSILAKLDPHLSYNLYESYTSFAEHVAKSSGGFLRFLSVSKEEKILMKLNMINPIAPVPEEE